MDTMKNDVDVVSPAASEATAVPAAGADSPSRAASGTPLGIKSSPPAIASQVMESVDTDDMSPLGVEGDSEAETVVPNGHSPSKSRRERRVIKLEDKSNESGIPEDVNVDVDMENTDGKEAPTRSDIATSTLGKRKRSKHGHHGNPSGLSSAPTSPVVVTTKNSSNAPGTESESDASKSSSSRNGPKDKSKSVDDKVAPKADPDAGLDNEKERKRFRRQQSSGADSSSNQNKRSGESKSAQSGDNPRKPTRSPSPPASSHRRSVSSNATNGVSHKKKRIPAPLIATRDRASVEQHSDSSSSAGESPHPRGSRTRNLVTPPTGDSLNKMPRGKNAHHRTPLMNACDKGNLESAKQFLRDNPGDLDAADPEGNTPLQCASLNGHADVVKMLLEAGCNVHTLNNERDSPLLDAAENGHLDVVKLLLAAGVNPKQRNRAGYEPIEKIREDADDYDDIYAELSKARASWVGNGTYTRPSLPVHSPHPENESSSARSRRTQSHGRSAKTGDSLLYTSFDINSLRRAAGRGDVETAVNIINVLAKCDDIQTLVAAARGGHDEALGMILALTGMNPDSPPLKDTEWDHATPMLAAIGGENIKVIEMLLRQEEFDPTRVYNGMTYPEWAKHNKGPLWREEERILQEAFDQYKKHLNQKSSTNNNSPTRTHGHRQRLSDHSVRSNGSVSRDQGSNDSRKRGGSPSATATPAKRGPGRPRKEGRDNDNQDREVVAHKEKTKRRASHSDDDPSSPEAEADAEATKPRRKKLLSGKEMKEEQQIRQRRTSFASMGSTASTVGETMEGKKSNAISGKNSTSRLTSSVTEPDSATERSRSRKDGDSKDRLALVRDDSPAKRARSSMTPPSSPRSDHGVSNKRRRLEGIHRGEARHSSSPDRRSQLKEKIQSSHLRDKNKITDSGSQTAIKREPEHVSPTPEEKLAMEHKLEAERRQAELDAKRAAEEEAARQAEEATRLAAQAAKEEAERKKAEELRIAATLKEEREKAERLAKEEEERQQRQKEKEAEAARREEEAKQRQLELERQRKEEREQKQREMERQRELRRLELEEIKRRKEKEEEEARLAKLPALLRWFDRYQRSATAEVASNFTTIQGVRYDTIRPEASGSPDAREQWILNSQVALLLGEKDLQLSRYTAWERIPVSIPAKRALWGLENSRYAMLDSATGKFNPEFWFDERIGSYKPPRAPGRLEALRSEAQQLFLALDLTFIKLSDFLSVIHLHPHLRNLPLTVHYRELPPPGWTFEAMVWPPKWKQDADAVPDTHGNGPFAPGAKIYINGQLAHVEEKAKYAQASKTPYRERFEDRVPRRGLRQVFPHHADYTQLCIEQGLTHLLPNGTVGNGVSSRNGVTPPTSNASTNEEPRRASETSPGSQLMLQEPVNGINGTL